MAPGFTLIYKLVLSKRKKKEKKNPKFLNESKKLLKWKKILIKKSCE